MFLHQHSFAFFRVLSGVEPFAAARIFSMNTFSAASDETMFTSDPLSIFDYSIILESFGQLQFVMLKYGSSRLKCGLRLIFS